MVVFHVSTFMLQLHKGVVFFFGGGEGIRLHFYFVKIDFSLGRALASNSPPTVAFDSSNPFQAKQ